MPINKQRPFSKSKIISSLILILLISVIYQIYQHWQVLLQISVSWQKQLNHSLTELLQATSQDPLQSGFLLIAISFLYGVLHSVGPGHGKLIITTYIATNPTRLKQSVILSLLSSLLQGLVAIVLVSTILIIFQFSTRHLNLVSQYSEKLSYGFVILLGVLCCIKALRQLSRIRKQRQARLPQIRAISPLNRTQAFVMQPQLQVNSICDCGHQHVVSPQQLPISLKTQAIVVFSMGLRPCSGALLVLIFSYVIGVYEWGIMAAMAMALGTALTICTIAFFVYFLRDIAVRLAQKQGFSFSPYWRIVLGLSAGLVFILLGLLMYQSLALGEMGSPLVSPRRI